MAASTAATLDLWKRAVDSLDPQMIQSLHPAKTGMRDIVNSALKAAQAKREISIKKRWRIARRSKEDIIVRDVMEKIIYWIHRFKDIGDNAVQYDPAHAALPWAAVRFILQAAINYTEVEREVFESMELVTRLLASFREVENIYIEPNSPTELQDAIVGAYATILESLSETVKFLAESKKIRGLKAPIRLTGNESLNKLLNKENEVLRFTRLVDGKRLLNVTTKVDRTTELAAIADMAVQDQRYAAVLDWLSKTRYLDHHNGLRALRSPGTGDWLINHAEYTSWHARSSSSTLLVHGIPGCGKTILCSRVIDEAMSKSLLTPNKSPIAFFYCSAAESEQDRRDAASVLRSLTRQLTAAVSRHPRIYSAALAVHDSKVTTAKQQGFDLLPPSISECEDMILAVLEDNPAAFVIDAVDEMDNSHELVSSLEMIRAKSTNVVKIFLTTRDSTRLLQTTKHAQRIRVTAVENHSDVELYITQSVERLAKHRSLNQKTRTQIIESLVSGAGETFQWAKLQLAQLQASKQPIIEQDLASQLARLASSTLGELYDTIFHPLISSQGTARELIIHAFSWLLYAQELFTTDVFLDIVAGAAGWKTPSPEELLHICHGFIYMDTQTNAIRFVHESVRAYLRAQPLLEPYKAQTLISQDCLRIFIEPPPGDLTILQPQRKSYDYATMYFGHHISTLESSNLTDEILKPVESFLFKNKGTALYARIWLETAKNAFDSIPSAHPQKVAMEVIISETCSPLFPICAFAMSHVLQRSAWAPDFDWNQRNTHGHTALYIAAYYGHASIISFLLNGRADPNVQCGRLGTALQCAAYRGHVEIVKLLLHHGAEPKLPGKFPTVMHAACRGGRENVVLALIENSDYPTSTQDEYDAVLSEVAKAGLAEALARLQDHPLSTTMAVGQSQQHATEAITSGNVNVLRFLLGRSTVADAISPGSLALSALHGREAMALFLISQGIDVDEQGHMGTPLRCASAYGHHNTYQSLLDHGADVNKNLQFGSALHAAAMRGHLHTVKLLLNHGADVNIRGGYYGTALQASSYHGHVELVRWLHAANADVHASGFCNDAIEAAREGGRPEIVQLFTQCGYRPRARPIRLSTHYPSTQARMRLPRADVLRDSSPGRKRLIRDTDGVPENVANQSATRDPFDPRSGAIPQLDIPLDILGSNIRTNNGQTHRRGSDLRFRALSLDYTSRADREVPRSFGWAQPQIQHDIQSAAANGDFDALEALFHRSRQDDAALGHYQVALQASIPAQPEVFLRILRNMKRGLSLAKSRSLHLICLPSASCAGWPHVVKYMLEEILPIASKELLESFDASCDAGSAPLVKILLQEMEPDEVRPKRLFHCIKSAAANGHIELLRLLLPMCQESLLKQHIREMFCVAAGRGRLLALEILASHDCWQPAQHQEALNAALNIAAYHGDGSTCTYLLNKGADVCARCLTPNYRNIHKSSRPPKSYDVDLGSWSGPKRKAYRCRRRDEAEGEGLSNKPSSMSPSESQTRFSAIKNPIESCMEFFEDRSNPSYSWTQYDKATHTQALEILLDSVASFAGTQWASTICKAAQRLPLELLESMVYKGASASAMVSNTCALSLAASRKLEAMSAVRIFLGSTAICDLGECDLQRALSAGLGMFQGSDLGWGSYNNSPQYGSLAEIFTTGPGAVVHYFLGQLPCEQATDPSYSVLLEMAAAANHLGLIELLIDHNVNVNSHCGHYGTALQASSRYGHRGVVKTLLRAGADPNVLSGRYGTALRAAVICHDLSIVQLMLGYGADTELCENGPSHEQFGDQASTGTALYLAIREQRPEIVHALIAAGADVKTTISYQEQRQQPEQPLLVMACAWGNTSIVRSLLAAGIDVQVSCKKPYKRSSSAGVSAMHAAIDGQHVDVVKLLFAAGFNINANIGLHESPLEFAVRQEADYAMLDHLLEFLPPNPTETLSKAMKAAIELSHLLQLEQLLEHTQTTLSSHAIFDLSVSACRIPDCRVVEVLFDYLCRCDDLDVESATATIDLREVRSENFEILLQYMPFKADMFLEACIRGDVRLIRRGLRQGFAANAEDIHGRPALHFAAAQGRTNVVNLLLNTLAAASHVHSSFGTPLVMALEGYSVEMLLSSVLDESGRLHAQELADLESLKYKELYADDEDSPFVHPPPQVLPYRKPKSHRGTQADYLDTISLLISHTAGLFDCVGKCGSAISLAAFRGSSELFEKLLTSGANMHGSGGALQSPFVAAIIGKQADMVERIARSAAMSILDPENRALHLACASCELPFMRLLHTYGYNCNAKDVSGQTALQISLLALAAKNRYDRSLPEAEAVIHSLLEAEPRATVTARDLTAAAKIESVEVRDRVLQALLEHSAPIHFPSDGFVRLVRSPRRESVAPGTVARQILDKNHITSLTREMIAAAYNVGTVSTLLDYFPSYIINSDSLDDVGRDHEKPSTGLDDYAEKYRFKYLADGQRRESMELLFRRGKDVVSSQANVIRALAVVQDPLRSRWWDSSEAPKEPRSDNLIDMMFKCNSNLTITDEMLTTASDPEDLLALLTHVKPGQQAVTASILNALVTRDKEDQYARRLTEKLLQVFLRSDPSIPLPAEVTQHFLQFEKLNYLGTLELLLRHEPSQHLSAEYVSSAIKSISRGQDHKHDDFIKILRDYRSRWDFSAVVQEAIDDDLREWEGEHRLRDLYMAFNGI